MAKILRKTQKIYASSAGATGITEYGSPASGTPAYSTDLDDIQTSAWETGWSAAALAGSEIPTFQDFNAIHYVFANQIGYLLQEGIPEYDAGTEYHQFSVVRKTGTYELYGSKTNTNTGNALPSQVDDTNWEYLGDLSQIGVTFANNTTSNTGTATDEALTPANFGTQQLKTTNGYQYLPGGIILQWAVGSSMNTESQQNITLPLTFPNAKIMEGGFCQTPTGSGGSNFNIQTVFNASLSQTSVYFQSYGSSTGSMTPIVFVIGY